MTTPICPLCQRPILPGEPVRERFDRALVHVRCDAFQQQVARAQPESALFGPLG